MKKYVLRNLDCAGCAAKIEDTLKKLEFVKSVSIDFGSASMWIDTDDIDKVIIECQKIEQDLSITEYVRTGLVRTSQRQQDEFKPRKELWITALCLGVYALALTLYLMDILDGLISWAVFVPLYLVSGWNVLVKAFKNILRGGLFDENFLMSIATIGAFIIGKLPEAAGVMIFFKIGTYLQELSIHRSRKSIKALLEIRPDYANLIRGEETFKVSPEDVEIGNEIVVKPGERIPLDGEIISGESQVDTSALTGESVPKLVKEKDTVLAGMINNVGLLKIRVTKLFAESSISKILELVENATHKKAKTEQFFTTFAKAYTPIVVGISFLTAILPPLFIEDATFSDWIYRALVILVISCPCALVVSIPLTYFGGIGGASRRGILIKGSSYIDAVNKVSKIVFDKTGTLTKGVFKLTEIKSYNQFSRDEILKIAAIIEVNSNHPIALSILQAYNEQHPTNCSCNSCNVKYEIKDYHEIAGQGLTAGVAQGTSSGVAQGEKNKTLNILVGNARLMKANDIVFEPTDQVGTVVYIAVDGVFAGYLIISDELKDDSFQAIKKLKKMGIKYMSMLSGDNSQIAEDISKNLGLDSYYADLLPEDKVTKLESLLSKNKNEKLIYVGDGINDAPVLALADIGISMGSLGSDAAIETADVVIMNDSLTKIPELIQISKKTRSIIWQNIIFSLSIKLLFVVLGIFGVAEMWEAVFADVGVALLAVLNAGRILRHK